MHFAKLVRKVRYRRYLLLFVNGFLFACLIYFYTEDNYENQVFKSIADYVADKTPVKSEEALLLQSLHISKYLGDSRSFIFHNKNLHSWKVSLIHPATVDLMTGDGACGSYAYILSYILDELKIPNRIAQMKVGNIYGGHILVEAKTSKGWAVLDGSFDVFFRKKDGGLASFSDVNRNWEFYKRQVPANYNMKYCYEGVRYTNWSKMPVVLPFVKKILDGLLGKEKADKISIRKYFFRKFRVLFNLTIFIYISLICYSTWRYFKTTRKKSTLKVSAKIPSGINASKIKISPKPCEV